MTDKLELFITEHKHEFDTMEPASHLWTKLDAQMNAKSVQAVKSKLLSKVIYLGLSSVVAVSTIYFVLNKKTEENKKPTTTEQHTDVTAPLNTTVEKENAKTTQESFVYTSNKKQSTEQPNSDLNADKMNLKQNIGIATTNDSMKLLPPIVTKDEPTADKKYAAYFGDKPNQYFGTIWNSSEYCNALRSFRFPGKVTFEGTVKVIGCNDLPKNGSLKAVYVKGTTSKTIVFAVGNGFKNIKLIKPNGKIIHPVAISDYTQNAGLMTHYTGTYFNITFTDAVEIVLFFPELEKGDKVYLGNVVEAIVK